MVSTGDDLYMREDTIRYKIVSYGSISLITIFQAPKFAFGQGPRLAVEKPKYDFYENALFLDDPITADLNRKPHTGVAKIGTEPRVRSFNFELF